MTSQSTAKKHLKRLSKEQRAERPPKSQTLRKLYKSNTDPQHKFESSLMMYKTTNTKQQWKFTICYRSWNILKTWNANDKKWHMSISAHNERTLFCPSYEWSRLLYKIRMNYRHIRQMTRNPLPQFTLKYTLYITQFQQKMIFSISRTVKRELEDYKYQASTQLTLWKIIKNI